MLEIQTEKKPTETGDNLIHSFCSTCDPAGIGPTLCGIPADLDDEFVPDEDSSDDCVVCEELWRAHLAEPHF